MPSSDGLGVGVFLALGLGTGVETASFGEVGKAFVRLFVVIGE